MTISTSSPSLFSSSATASALRRTWDWSKLLAETLGMRTRDSRSARTCGMSPDTRARRRSISSVVMAGEGAASVTSPTLPMRPGATEAVGRWADAVITPSPEWFTRGVDRVAEAFAAVQRADFLPRAVRDRASYDGPLALGHGGTCSQPRTVADMLRLLEVRTGDRVLDVGAGSGWTTALLAHLVGPTGRVLGVEIERHLAASGAANVARAGMPWAQVRAADPATLGAPDDGPWDRILVSAEARHLPQQLVDQLCDPGRLVAPVAGRMVLAALDAGQLTVTRHGHYRFVPLRPPTAPEAGPAQP